MDFNPFEDINENKIEKPISLTIWLEILGKKKNTYCIGWDIPKDELKEHVSKIKKVNGCGGSVKELKDDNEKSVVGMHFQGDVIDYLKNYLIKQGIDAKSIYIRG